ncbi:MAG: hypothetical protein PHP57_05660 [Sideroxydans sp.]|nr:hypothetical protein [Sideroxydans sp.]
MLKRVFAVFVLMVAILFTPYFGFTQMTSEFLAALYMGDMPHVRAMLTGEEDDSQFTQLKHGVALKNKPEQPPVVQSQVAAGPTVETGVPK